MLPARITGPGPSADTGTVWNNPTTPNTTISGLVNSSGSATSLSFASTGITGNFSIGVASSTLLQGYVSSISADGPATFTFGGLNTGLGLGYDLYAIMNSNVQGRATKFTVGSGARTVTAGANLDCRHCFPQRLRRICQSGSQPRRPDRRLRQRGRRVRYQRLPVGSGHPRGAVYLPNTTSPSRPVPRSISATPAPSSRSAG